MAWFQKKIQLKAQRRGFHLITNEVLQHIPEIQKYKVGIANFFIQHTSASLTINENADPDVRADFESHFNHMIPENAPYYVHVLEGPDDMPAHLKSSVLGSSLQVPISSGNLALGIWQGIYLCEHRDNGGARHLCVTINGEVE